MDIADTAGFDGDDGGNGRAQYWLKINCFSCFAEGKSNSLRMKKARVE